MSARRMGVEEELFLADDSGAIRGVAGSVVRAAERGTQRSGAGDEPPFDREIQSEQVETASAPCATADELRGELRRWRRAAAEAAARSEVGVAALATPPPLVEPHVTEDGRYDRITELYGLVATEQLTCGCHVHVDVESLEEGVGVVDRIGPWLPVLRAVTANSPYWAGADTGYGSYRTVVWDRWPSAGPVTPFGSLEGYDRAVAAMIDTGTLLDEGMVYFDVRLARSQGTVEVRVGDVCLDPEDTVLYAVLARALVTTGARAWRDGRPAADVRREVLALAHWRAARSGMEDTLVDPRSGRPEEADAVLGALVEHVGDALAETGDVELVEAGRARLRERGTGATTQRAIAAEHGGALDAVVREAVRRTAG